MSAPLSSTCVNVPYDILVQYPQNGPKKAQINARHPKPLQQLRVYVGKPITFSEFALISVPSSGSSKDFARVAPRRGKYTHETLKGQVLLH